MRTLCVVLATTLLVIHFALFMIFNISGFLLLYLILLPAMWMRHATLHFEKQQAQWWVMPAEKSSVLHTMRKKMLPVELGTSSSLDYRKGLEHELWTKGYLVKWY